MAYQPKSYRKFVATAATATLVASAVTPAFAAETGAAASFTDVPERYNTAVSYLVDNKITLGLTPETYGTQQTIKRVDAAVMIAKALELNIDGAPDSGFTDVPARAKAYVDALKAAGLINGKTATTFGSEQEITRGEMALIIASAYEITGDTANVKFTDVSSRYSAAVAALVEKGITNGTSETSFGTTASIKRGDFAIFLYRAETLPTEEILEVASVQSTSSTSIEVTFNNELTAEEAAELEFAFDPALAVTDVKIKDETQAAAEGDAKTTVVLTTEEQAPGTTYNLVAVNGVALETEVPVNPAPVTEAAIKSLTATGVKELTVNFEGPVANTANAVFTVKKGASTIGVVSSTWNEAKTAVELEINSKLTEGTYTVSVAGLAEEALTASVAAQNEKVTEIKFLSESLVFTNATGDTATVGYQVLNQYGEDVTENVALAGGFNFSSSRGTAADDNKGKITVTGLSNVKAGDKVVVTVIDPTTAVTANATLTLVAEAKVSSVTLGDLYNKDGKTLSEDTVNEDFYILVSAKDQYGNDVKEASKLNADLTILSSNQGIVAVGSNAVEELTINNQKQLAIKVDPIVKGNAVISVIANANGSAASKTVTVEEGVKVDTITLGTPAGTVAGGATIKIPVDAVDNKGQKVTKVADLNGNTVTVNQNGDTLSGTFVQENGALFLQVTTAGVAANTVENLIVSVTSETGKYTSKVFQVQPNAVATAITGLDAKVSRSILEGESVTITEDQFIVEDQYGNRIEDTSKYGVRATSGDANKIVATTSGDTTTITASSDSALVTFTLTNNSGAPVSPASSVDVRFSTVKQSQFTSYRVDSLGTIYATTDSAYFKELKVYGVTASGSEVLLPNDRYNVTSHEGTRVHVNGTTGKTTVEGTTSGVDDDTTTTSVPQTKEAKVTVVINATGTELTATGTVSAAAPKTAKLEARTSGTKTGEVISSYTLAGDNVLNLADLQAILYSENQYGVETSEDAAKLTFTNLVNAGGSATPVISNNGLTNASIANLESGDTVTVKITLGDVATTVNVVKQ